MNNLQKLREDPMAYVYRTLHNLWQQLLCAASTSATRIDATLRGVHIGTGLKCWGRPTFHREAGATIRIGRQGAIRTSHSSNNVGLYTETRISANTRGAVIEIGNNVGLSAVTIAAFDHIEIGDNCLIGGNVLITDSDWHPIVDVERLAGLPGRTAPIHIGRDVFIGARAIILKGTTIGDRSVIGAGSVVSGVIPPDVVVAGNPCRIVRNLK
jgi:acetyltransferase-like isoleucine patch superfamily enzyme